MTKSRAVHPRACGEQSPTASASRVAIGSSPRMRGTERKSPIAIVMKRFIPAHAGNSSGDGDRRSFRAVHPRACGEQSLRRCNRANRRGSSPRMRGTGRR
ncbi:conserved hypothetical protein [Rhodospirillum rubrum ATCC 11170]|nr:conserved hypothetical protein [Rhodospirillum rubrum ATCC 11170]